MVATLRVAISSTRSHPYEKENLGNACNNAIYMHPTEFTCERSAV